MGDSYQPPRGPASWATPRKAGILHLRGNCSPCTPQPGQPSSKQSRGTDSGPRERLRPCPPTRPRGSKGVEGSPRGGRGFPVQDAQAPPRTPRLRLRLPGQTPEGPRDPAPRSPPTGAAASSSSIGLSATHTNELFLRSPPPLTSGSPPCPPPAEARPPPRSHQSPASSRDGHSREPIGARGLGRGVARCNGYLPT